MKGWLRRKKTGEEKKRLDEAKLKGQLMKNGKIGDELASKLADALITPPDAKMSNEREFVERVSEAAESASQGLTSKAIYVNDQLVTIPQKLYQELAATIGQDGTVKFPKHFS